jgi:tight adherence protein B
MRRAIAVMTTAVALLAASSASASGGTLTVKSINTSKFPTVAVTVQATGTPGATPQFKVKENGRDAVNPSSGAGEPPAAIALLVDTSRSMAGHKMRDAIKAAKSFVDEQPPNNIVGVYGFGAKPYTAAPLSNDPSQLDIAIQQLNVNGPPGTALYGAVKMAAQDLKSQVAQKKVIVLLTDGRSEHDTSTAAKALAEAKGDGVDIYTIGIATDAGSSAALKALSGPTGGTSAVATSSTQLATLYKHVSDSLGATYTFTYESLAQPGKPIHLQVSARGYAPVTYGTTAPGHVVVSHGGSGGFKVPTTAAGRLGLGIIAGLIVLLATLALLGAKPSVALHKRIAAHTESRKTAAVEGDNPANERLSAMQSLFIATEKIIGSMNFWQRMAGNLERADLPLRTAELFYIQIASALFLGVLCALLLGQKGILTLVAMIIGAAVPALVVRFKAHQRLGKFEHQLSETLITMAASLKAGHAFNQSIQSVVKEGADPTSKEFARVVAETQLGMPAEAALEAMAQRMNSYNFGFVVMAVNIQRTVGGSLADILDMVSDTVRQRQQFERKVKALTAQGRMSAYVLLAMPFLMALAIFALNKAYIMILFTSSAGRILIGIALFMMSIGAVIIKKIVSFKG